MILPRDVGRADTTHEHVRDYWNSHIHDLEVVSHQIGTPGFFEDLERYRFDKLRYLPQLIDFDQFRGKGVLEIGCGAGIDLVHFARAGAEVVGIDLADVSIELASLNFQHRGLKGHFEVMDGEAMSFDANSFDVVYAHGVLQYTANPGRMVQEIRRVLRSGGLAILMAYNRRSWLNWISKLTATPLEHQDAPVYRMMTEPEFRDLLGPFARVETCYERFPVPTELHSGWKALLFNQVFVRGFNLLPRSVIEPFGWHILAFAHKA